MAHLVIGDQALLGTVLEGGRREAHGDALKGIAHGGVIDVVLLAAGREDGRLIEQVGEVGAGEPRSAGRPVGEGNRISKRPAARMHRKDVLASLAVGQVDGDAAIETSGTQ